MGEIEIDTYNNNFIISSHIITYGNAADESITERIRDEIETMWNEPRGKVTIQHHTFDVIFRITAQLHSSISEIEIYSNVDPRNNYFRIEEFANGNISFVDGLGCNSGYFLLENLYTGSTTAAHEYGHTLGLGHPKHIDYRSKGRPGIMYPRGTLVDPEFQYEPAKPAGVKGGTMHPMYRKVLENDITDLELERRTMLNTKGIIGEFTNVYHYSHKENFIG